MAKPRYIKQADGKLAGSIGVGMTETPNSQTAPTTPVPEHLTGTAATSNVDDLAARFAANKAAQEATRQQKADEQFETDTFYDLGARMEAIQRKEHPEYWAYRDTAQPIPRWSGSEYEVFHRTDYAPEHAFKGEYKNYDPAKTTVVGNRWAAQVLTTDENGNPTRVVGIMDIENLERDTAALAKNPAVQYFSIPAFNDHRDMKHISDAYRDPRTGISHMPNNVSLRVTRDKDGNHKIRFGRFTRNRETGTPEFTTMAPSQAKHYFGLTVGRKASKNSQPWPDFNIALNKDTGKPLAIEYDTAPPKPEAE
jgi:hypothetical protein